jgi:hypothetical protein
MNNNQISNSQFQVIEMASGNVIADNLNFNQAFQMFRSNQNNVFINLENGQAVNGIFANIEVAKGI